jgi:hypothetical protein
MPQWGQGQAKEMGGEVVDAGFDTAPGATEVAGLGHPGRALVKNKAGFRWAFGRTPEYAEQE